MNNNKFIARVLFLVAFINWTTLVIHYIFEYLFEYNLLRDNENNFTTFSLTMSLFINIVSIIYFMVQRMK